MEDIKPYILKTVIGIPRKIALELYSLEDDRELREIFEPVGGIESGIIFFSLLNGQVDAWTQLFKSKKISLCIVVILNYYKLILMELMFISKHITSKYLFFVKYNTILMMLIFTVRCCIYNEYKEFIHAISGSTSVLG